MEGLLPILFRAIKSSRSPNKYHQLVSQNSGSSHHRPLLLHNLSTLSDEASSFNERSSSSSSELRRRTYRPPNDQYGTAAVESYGSTRYSNSTSAMFISDGALHKSRSVHHKA